MKVTPVNYRPQDAGDEAIRADVDYALQIADFYVRELPDGAASLVDRALLEIGPGYSLGSAVLLACQGARVTVADRYLAAWDDTYHGRFFAALRDRLRGERPDLSPAPVRSLLERASFDGVLRCVHSGIEDLGEVDDGCFDAVLSNAVFEHVEDVPGALETLARITRAGGMGIHQVDFRDHRDFDRPLDYLTLDQETFRSLFREVRGECGNRWRHDALGAAMEAAGFEVTEFTPNMFASESYLDDVAPRLHPDFGGLSREALRVTSGCFRVRRRVGLNTEYPIEEDHPQTLAHTRTRYAFASQFALRRSVLDVGCGAGVGTRLLAEAGGTPVVGVDVRPEALALARDAAGLARYEEADLEEGLPFEDASFGLVVCLEVLEHVANQDLLLKEVRRVLAPDGVALISVPNQSFERFWTGLAGERNPYHVRVPSPEEFVEMLDPFEWVELMAQVDVVSSLVLPLEGDERRTVPGVLEAPAGASLTDTGTVALIALCRRQRPLPGALAAPIAHSYGNHQTSFGSAIEAGQNLERDLARARYERFVARSRLEWSDEEGSDDPSGGSSA